MSNFLVNRHTAGTIDVVYTRSIEGLTQIQNVISREAKSIETHLLNADVKGSSKVLTPVVFGRISPRLSGSKNH